MRFQQAPYRIADVVALLFILHGNTSFGSLAPIIPYRSCKRYLEETDNFPSELSCAEAAVSAPQSITANIMAATVVTDFVYNIVARGKLTTRYAVFSAASINVRAESNNKRQRRTA